MKSVAIEREFGSGGRDIGIRIAKEAQIPYYDGQLLIEAAKGYGIEIAALKEFDENKVGSFLYNIAMMAGYNQYENMAKINEIFYGMKETIKNLHAEGPAVFIGRCSTEILKSIVSIPSGRASISCCATSSPVSVSISLRFSTEIFLKVIIFFDGVTLLGVSFT